MAQRHLVVIAAILPIRISLSVRKTSELETRRLRVMTTRSSGDLAIFEQPMLLELS